MKEGACADIWRKVFKEEGIGRADALGKNGLACSRTAVAGREAARAGG